MIITTQKHAKTVSSIFHIIGKAGRQSSLLVVIMFTVVLNSVLAQPDSTGKETNGYSIKVIYPGHAGEQIILGHYYDYMVMGYAQLNLDEQSSCEFSGPTPLKGGLYTFIVNGQVVQGDFIVDKDQHFMIYLDDQVTNGSVFQEFSGSEENDKLLEYQSFMTKQGEQIQHFHQLLSLSVDAEESMTYFDALEEIDDRIRKYRAQIVKDNPESTLGVILASLPEPKLPDHLDDPQNKKDSMAVRKYMSDHFWDETKFWDGRLAYTPFLSDKLDRYFAEILIPEKEVVIKEIDKILGNAVADSMMYQMILRKVIYGSKDHFFKWDDDVFIHLYENYLVSEPVYWLDDQERKEIDKHAFFLMGNSNGAPAPDISLNGFDDKINTLYDLEAEYTVLAFWDPTCDKCKWLLPKLDSLYRTGWKEHGVRFYAIGIESDATEADWRSLITEKQITDWTHVYYSRKDVMAMAEEGKPLVTKSYDVWYFPTFFLLDKDKKFMARKLSFKKISELINSILVEEQ